MQFFGRTDLASEARSMLSVDAAQLSGVEAREDELYSLRVNAVEILSQDGAEKLSKPMGKYFTLSLGRHFERGSENFENAARALAELIRRCMGQQSVASCLIAALGNPDITPDALGSLAASNILVTRHLKAGGSESFKGFISTTLCRTGVLGTTGVESAAQIRALCALIKPELVIAVDALAGSELDDLCRSIQVCDSGISPGSGVGNDREALNFASLGVPVVAVGMPTVIDASALCRADGLEGLFVTPRGIDSLVRNSARVIGYGINLALHPGLTVEDIDMLVG